MSGKDFIKSRILSIQYALDGIKYVLVTQQNAWIHAIFTLAVVSLGFLFGINRLEWITLFLTVGLVWVAELFNTAVEALVDLISPEHNNTAKICKDVSAGSVFVSALISILVGLMIFGPPLWQWIRGLFK
ncbi:MAG: diacylglycerol kinase family protein [Anaerolineales bacterium]|nr:diacylglycerol kinase family protein [Anaerolineales bacterium]